MMNNSERRGFAIPTALLVISVLTIMVAGGFTIVSAERRSVADQKSQVSAFRIAEQGLEVYLIRRDSMATAGSLVCNPAPCERVPGDSDRVQIAVPGGYAQVSLTRIRAPRNNQSGLYVARSMGTETSGAYANTPQGVRTVAQYVLWQPAPMQVLAGWTALNGLRVNGNSATIGGADLCGQAATVDGVDVPINPGYSGKLANVTGDPAVDTVENMADSVHIDWNGIINNHSIQPSIIIPGGSFPPESYFIAHPDYYPV